MPEKAEINALNLSFSGISVDKIDAGIKRICDVIQQEKSKLLKSEFLISQTTVQSEQVTLLL